MSSYWFPNIKMKWYNTCLLVSQHNTCVLVFLNRILTTNVPHDIVKHQRRCLPVALMPHKFVQIRRHLVVMQTFHMLYSGLHSIPLTLNILCMYSCDRIYKMKGMIHCSVCRNVQKTLNLAICLPFVRIDDCARKHMGLDNWEKGVCISPGHHLHVPKSRLVGYIN